MPPSVATCLVLQHVAPERPYAIADALEGAGVTVEACELFAGASIPTDVDGLGGIVVMGGPMSAGSDEDFPTRREEVALLSRALVRGVPTLGVCLGAQLLAAAGGGKVYPGEPGPEIGWAPVTLTALSAQDPLFSGLAAELTVLHWHAETFDLPHRAVLLASSSRYPNQAFRIGPRAWGLQFHLEVDNQAVGAFLESFGDQAVAAGVRVEEIAAGSQEALAHLEPSRRIVLRRFAALVSRTPC